MRDNAFDALLTGESRFDDLPRVMPRLADGTLPALCHGITYDAAATAAEFDRDAAESFADAPGGR